MYDDASNNSAENGEAASKLAKTEAVEQSKKLDDDSKVDSTYSLGVESIWGQSPLNELSDQQVMEFVLHMDSEYRHLKYENIMFKQFLLNNDPAALDGYDALLAYLKKCPGEGGPPPATLHSRIVSRSPSSIMGHSAISLSSVTAGRGPKINLSQKSDMVLKAMEEIQENLEAFLKKSHRLKQNLKANLDEYTVRESDIAEARVIFEHNIVLHGTDPLTQRIPAEKFIRYMMEWLKSAQLNIEKLRLRMGTLKVQYKKVSATLEQRKELRENVHAVDFDQLNIENQYYRDKIGQKSLYLLQLKRMNGGHNLSLSNRKNYLYKLQNDFNNLNAAIAAEQKVIEDTEEQCCLMEQEIEKTRDKYERIKRLRSTYNVPDVMEYVKLKNKLYDLKKNIKVWERRKYIQDITMNTCLRQMKNITGSSTVDPAWLEDPTPEDSDDGDFVTWSQ